MFCVINGWKLIVNSIP